MTEIMMIGIDLGKKHFQLCAVGPRGTRLWSRSYSASKMRRFFSKVVATEVVMEACGGAHYWAGELKALGHCVSLLHPRHVTPFVMGPHKSDERDAFAITLAAGCPEIPRIVPKERDARELQGLLRLHHGLVCQRTSQINRLRGLLREQGWVFSKGVARGLAGFRVALEALSERSGDLFVTVFGEELSALEALNCREKALKRRLDRLAREDWQCRLLMSIPGLGPLSALALVAAVPDASVFDAARGFAAWLGLVPRQHGTGGKTRLGSITRHGNSYIRRNLVQGAKSLIWAATGKAAEPNPCCRLRRWIRARHGSLHINTLAVAVANRIARAACAIMQSGRPYDPRHRELPA